MSLAVGSKLGPYEILGPLGAGGMGEVYRAKDPRFGREVAVKVLPANLSADPDRLQRFEQEARAAGALNHPNILSVYDIGTSDHNPYLVSELLEGETLREKLDHGPLPYRKAIDYALQTARGLFAAHDKGIVHRDAKPENLFITKDGRVKILDFGLAKLTQQDVPEGELTQLPTTPGTDPGVVLGTMGYMSPEQVRGKPADHRSDIFTFGAILYEMLTGEKAFRGETPADTMSAILHKEPPEITQSNPSFSLPLSRIVQHCMEKDPEQRFQSASDIAFALESLSSPSETGSVAASITPTLKRSFSLWHLVSAVAILTAVFFGFLYFRAASAPKRIYYTSIEIPEGWEFDSDLGGLALSPDGGYLAFTANSARTKQIWIRALDQPSARLLSDTEGGFYPFWSPDSRWIGFFTRGKLKKIAVDGGPSQTICDASEGRGGSWNQDGTILFAPAPYGGLYRVSASGGKPEPVTAEPSSARATYRWPSFLPDGRHFLFTIQNSDADGIYSGSLESKEIRIVNSDWSNAVYASPGFLLFRREGNLIAQPFDVDQMTTKGNPLVVLPEKVEYTEAKNLASFAISKDDTLVYQEESWLSSRVVWLDRSGNQFEAKGDPAYQDRVTLSPDSQKACLRRIEPQTGERDLWVQDLSSGRTERLTFRRDPNLLLGIWSPDQSYIAYSTGWKIYKKAVSGAGEELLAESKSWMVPNDWSSDGKTILISAQTARGDEDIWMIPTDGSKKVRPFLETRYGEKFGSYSPDGKWVAYTSNASGQDEIFVRPSDGSDRQWQISSSGGTLARWRTDGKELYYFSAGSIFSVSIEPGSKLKFGVPGLLFKIPDNVINGDLSWDGQRFLMLISEKQTIQKPFRAVVNWLERLRE